ncbi:MAG: glucose 1-dehydrogenase [Chloroflexota bacterium]
MRLAERVAVVTGGGYGIGRAYSLGLAREGAAVVVADLNDEGAKATEHAIKAAGGRALAVHTDVADEASTAAMAQAAVGQFGRIDVLVNNAALFTALPLRSFDEMEAAEWDRVMAVNLRGPFLCCKAVVPHMKQRRYGKIINISSGSIMSGNPKRIHYVTSKAGLIGFTRSMARALGEYNICVNSLMPGSTASEGAIAVYGEQFFQQGYAGRALKRVQQPEDLVGALLYLSSADSDFVTGAALGVDGGHHMY